MNIYQDSNGCKFVRLDDYEELDKLFNQLSDDYVELNEDYSDLAIDYRNSVDELQKYKHHCQELEHLKGGPKSTKKQGHLCPHFLSHLYLISLEVTLKATRCIPYRNNNYTSALFVNSIYNSKVLNKNLTVSPVSKGSNPSD